MNRIEPISPAIIDAFLPEMSPGDLRDLEQFGGVLTLRSVVERAVHTFAGMVDGTPQFIGGMMADGRVWMLGGVGIAKAKRFYLRETRAQVAHMLGLAPLLWTGVEGSYTRSLRWLRWLGFSIDGGRPHHGRIIFYAEKRR